MHNVLLRAVICAILVYCPFGRLALAGGFTVVLPPDRSFVESEVVSVVLSAWTMMDEVQISVNNKNQPLSSKPFNRIIICYDGIHLSRGMNTIKIRGFKNREKTQEAMVQIFVRSDLSTDAGSAPPGFQQYLFHTEKYESECQSCHELDFRKVGESQQTADQSPCYLCHKKILSNYAYVHGPAAVWSCFTCHDRASKDPELEVRNPLSATCANCHEISWKNKKYLHAPTAAGACTICHNPHASNREYFLRMYIRELCTACHDDMASRPHVIGRFLGIAAAHPTNNRPDTFHPGRMLTCVSCHNPHGGNSASFLNNYDDSMSMQLFCSSCHIQ